MAKNPEIQHIHDYYVKIIKKKPVLKEFYFRINSTINDITLMNKNYNFQPGDSIELSYSFGEKATPKFENYMEFLHNAYKSEDILVTNRTANSWSKVYKNFTSY